MIDFFLKPNSLTQNPNDYVAVVFQTDVFTEKELARDISKTVGGFTEGQVAQILEAYTKCVGALLAHGSNIKTGLFSTSFSICGTFAGPEAEYNPAVNTIKVHARLNSALTAAAKSAPKTKHAGVVGGPVIDAVVDLSTGETNSGIHAGANARIVGSKIKLSGDAPNVGIAFIDADNNATLLPTASISVNSQKVITFIVPPLTAGTYRVKVTTQYNGSAKPGDTVLSYTFPTPIAIAA